MVFFFVPHLYYYKEKKIPTTKNSSLGRLYRQWGLNWGTDTNLPSRAALFTNFIRYIWQYHSNQVHGAAILTQLFQQTIFTDKYVFSVIVRDGDQLLISIYIYSILM